MKIRAKGLPGAEWVEPELTGDGHLVVWTKWDNHTKEVPDNYYYPAPLFIKIAMVGIGLVVRSWVTRAYRWLRFEWYTRKSQQGTQPPAADRRVFNTRRVYGRRSNRR